MEILVVLIIILVICMILNVSINYILLGAAILIGLVSGAMALGFLVCGICLLFSKRKEARFLRMDYTKNSKYQVAYYLVEGTEYPCIFPGEGIMESRLYRKDRLYHVMLNQRMGRVFDRFAVTTCVLGLVCSVGLVWGIYVWFG